MNTRVTFLHFTAMEIALLVVMLAIVLGIDVHV